MVSFGDLMYHINRGGGERRQRDTSGRTSDSLEVVGGGGHLWKHDDFLER